MTSEELNQKYAGASWLIARRSAVAAGKALMFGSEGLEVTIAEIGRIYELTDQEVASILGSQPSGSETLKTVGAAVESLLGAGVGMEAGNALSVAHTAIENGHTGKMLATLVSHGPNAAKAMAETGKLATKGLPWGWIAAAGYAVGSTGWFAYNARAYNLELFEFVQRRDGLQLDLPPIEIEAIASDNRQPISVPDTDKTDKTDKITLSVSLPTPKAVLGKAGEVSSKASTAISGVWGRFRQTKA